MTTPDGAALAPSARPEHLLAAAARLREAVLAEVHKAVVGQEEALELVLCGVVAGGHVLLEGIPGVAKTLIG